MFPGLVMTSVATMAMGVALFQRRAKAGWLGELESIRSEALEAPAGGVAAAMTAEAAAEDAWPELTKPTSEDPHGINSLYYAEPELEVGVEPAGSGRKARQERRMAVQQARVAAGSEQHAPEGEPEVTPPEQEPSPTASEAPEPSVVPPMPDADPSEHAETLLPVAEMAAETPVPVAEVAAETAADVAGLSDVAAWTQPAPHPVRPSELWHAAARPASLDALDPALPVEERIDSAELVGRVGSAGPGRLERLRPAVVDGAPPQVPAPEPAPTERRVGLSSDEAELLPQPDGSSMLIQGPVARRVRRDRPADRRRAALPSVLERTAGVPVDQLPAQSPLPSPRLPAAALPSPSARLRQPPPAVIPRPDEVPEIGAPAVEIAEPTSPATVRLDPNGRATSSDGSDGPEITLAAGWCWIAPSTGPAPAVAATIVVPAGSLCVSGGASVLAVAEGDGSTFLVLVGGEALLRRDDGDQALAAGDLVMAVAGEAPQIDRADASEIAADPLVAHNLELDAAR